MKEKFLDLHTNLKFVAMLSAVIIIIRQFILYNVPEFFSIGQELGELLFNLCIGYLLTYLFYYLTIYRPEQEHKKRAYAYAKEFVRKIAIAYDSLVEDLNEVQQQSLNAKQLNPNSTEELTAILKKIDSKSLSLKRNNRFIQITWAEIFLIQRNQIERFLREITLVYVHLEPQQNEIITKMLSHHFLEDIRNTPLEEVWNLDFLAQGMSEFNSLIENLKNEFIKD